MARKIDTSRLYMLTRALVFIVSSVLILVGLINILTYREQSLYLHRQAQQCVENIKKYTPNALTGMCWVDNDKGLDEIESRKSYLVIGIALLVFFYGGVAVFNYIFPKSGGGSDSK